MPLKVGCLLVGRRLGSVVLYDFEFNEKRKELNYGQFFICVKSG